MPLLPLEVVLAQFDGMSMNTGACFTNLVPLLFQKVRFYKDLVADSLKGRVWPTLEPVDSAAVHQRGEVPDSVSKSAAHRAHCQDDVQMGPRPLDEVILELFAGAGVV